MSVRMWTKWNSHPLFMKSIMVKSLRKFFITLNVYLPSNPAIPLLDIYPKELKTYIHKKTSTKIFIIFLFITAPNWKQLRCMYSNRRMAKLYYICEWNTIQQ